MFIKRICAIAIVFTLFATCAMAKKDHYAIPFFSADYTKVGLINPDGSIMLQPSFMRIARAQLPASGDVYFIPAIYDEAKQGIAYALTDSAACPITAFEFDTLGAAYNAFIYGRCLNKPAADGDEYVEYTFGLLSPSGEKLTEPIYSQIVSTHDGNYLAIKTSLYDGGSGTVYRILADGTETPTETVVSSLNNDFSGDTIPACNDFGLCGYLDKSGEWVIAPKYGYATDFYGDHAAARMPGGDMTGIINRSGEFVIVPQFDNVDMGYSTMDGTQLTYDFIIATQYDAHRIAFIDPATLKTAAEFDGMYANYLEDGLYSIASSDGSLRLINGAGETLYFVHSDDYPYFQTLGNGRIMLMQGDSAYIISSSGERLTGDLGPQTAILYDNNWSPCALTIGKQIRSGGPYDYGAAYYRYGLFTPDGVALLPYDYDYIQSLDADKFYARKGGVQGVMDINGAWLYAEYDNEKLMD